VNPALPRYIIGTYAKFTQYESFQKISFRAIFLLQITKAFFAEVENCIINLKNLSGGKMVFSKRKTGFIGLIIINILSVEFIIER
jgi:hypothetical protein